ncbi:MAG: hypothetical protein K2K21_09885 [Lachnospiraceae bacterium]|nr:hypothetical protein [Lachnospiraceae bacterium]
MINDIKLGIKIMRYGHGLVLNIILGVWFLVIGIAVIILSMSGRYINWSGGCFAIAAALMPIQIIFSLNASNMVLSSPVRKKMQTVVPTTITCISTLVMYIVVDLLLLIMICINPDRIPVACSLVTLQIVFAVFFMIYIPICYKYMVAAIIIGIIIWVCVINSIMLIPDINTLSFFNKGISSFLMISALGLPSIVVGGFLQYLLSLLFYKAPVSKYSQNIYLRKEL